MKEAERERERESFSCLDFDSLDGKVHERVILWQSFLFNFFQKKSPRLEMNKCHDFFYFLSRKCNNIMHFDQFDFARNHLNLFENRNRKLTVEWDCLLLVQVSSLFLFAIISTERFQDFKDKI